jgi:glycosyltransferase involved in cell wall biosynthesis
MSQPLVSIVIPFFNNETTLLDAIKSVFAQTYTNWELILLNDGSKDNSLQLAKSIKDNRVRVISDGQNRGLVFRLNQSPSLVNGEFIARMDGDDLMHPERIAKQMKEFFNNPDLDVVDTGAYSIDELGNPIGVRGLIPINYSPEYILKNAMLLHASIVAKKEWFEKYSYDPIYIRAEDRELWLRSYNSSNYGRVMEPLYIVREGKVNVKNYLRGLKTVIKIYKVYGFKILPFFKIRIEIIKSYFKIFVIFFLGLFNIHNIITKRRNKPLSDEESKRVSVIIKQIKDLEIIKS